MKIGLFGGTCDHLTVGHVAIIEKVMEAGLVDRMVVIPTIVDYHRKGKQRWLSDKQRVSLISAAMACRPYSSKVSIDLIEYVFKDEHSPEVCAERRFFHTVNDIRWNGTDSLANFKNWYRWEDVLKATRLIDVRGSESCERKNEELCEAIISIDSRYADVPATKMREMFSIGSEDGCSNEMFMAYYYHLRGELAK